MSVPFRLGVVSNCWAHQLPETGLLTECRGAAEAGYSYVELRQRTLAECEEWVAGRDLPRPIPERLGELAAAFPKMGFNLAVELPFMTVRTDPDCPYIDRLAEGAVALAGEGDRVLRFVDVSPATSPLRQGQAEDLGLGLAELARVLWEQRIRMVLENSRHPVLTLRALIQIAAQELKGVPIPRLCWDPGNQVAQRFAVEDPVETARKLPLEELFEFHFKQSRGGEPIPEVEDGDLDWGAITGALRERGYRGPALFEIPPGPDIWERLERGTAYVQRLLGPDHQ